MRERGVVLDPAFASPHQVCPPSRFFISCKSLCPANHPFTRSAVGSPAFLPSHSSKPSLTFRFGAVMDSSITEERSWLLSQICIAESDRYDIHSTIKILNAQIEPLRAQEHAITLEINQLTNARSLFSWLPDNIKQEIFLLCIGDNPEVDVPFMDVGNGDNDCQSDILFESSEDEDHYERDSDSDLGSDMCTDLEFDKDEYVTSEESDSASEVTSVEELLPPQQLILSHVCSRWRHIVLSTRQLWSSVFITCFNALSKRLANEWLSKADGYPISISISSFVLSSDEFDTYTELKDFLSAYRLINLDLPIYSKTWLELGLIIAELPDENISFLEKLSLTEMDGSGGKELLYLNNPRYPNLHFLELSGGDCHSAFVAPWNSLYELDISCCHVPFAQCLHILRQCMSLHTCSFGVEFLSNKTEECEPVYHPNLSVLLLSFVNPASVDIFLRSLTIPKLTSLTIDRAYFDYDRKLYTSRPLLGTGLETEYSNLMQRSNNPSIQYLSITYTDIPINIANILISSPTLTRLTIGYVAFGQQLEVLNDFAEGLLGPNLQHLGLVKLDTLGGLPSILEMILSRNAWHARKENPSVMPLRSVELLDDCLDDYLDDTDLATLVAALREAGVELKSLPVHCPWS